MAAALQHLDMDVLPEFWDPPASLIDRQRLTGLPRQGIGRSCKAGKEEIVGLLTALELFVAEGDAARHARWLADVERIAGHVAGAKHADAVVRNAEDSEAVPVLEIRMSGGASAALALVRALRDGEPAVHVDAALCDRGIVVASPLTLRPGDADIVGLMLARHL